MNNAEEREKLINWLAERLAELYGMKPKNIFIVRKAVKLANEIIERQLIVEAEQVKPWVPIE